MILRAIHFAAAALSAVALLSWSSADAHKLENYLDPSSSTAKAEVVASLTERQPRFLFRSSGTTTFTTTLSTATQCYATIGITGVCGKRKKRKRSAERAINTSPISADSGDDGGVEISPSAAVADSREDKALDLNQLDSSSSASSKREPRFAWYYTTTFSTTTVTATSFTATTTVSLTNCIPTTFSIAACG